MYARSRQVDKTAAEQVLVTSTAPRATQNPKAGANYLYHRRRCFCTNTRARARTGIFETDKRDCKIDRLRHAQHKIPRLAQEYFYH